MGVIKSVSVLVGIKMKLLAVVFSVLLASVNSMPQEDVNLEISARQGRLITDAIAAIIERATQAIADAGLDPLIVDHANFEYALPVPTIFNLRAYASGILFRGLSNIIINQLSYNAITLRAIFDVSVPEILLNVVDSEIDAKLFDADINCRYSGRLVLQNIVTTGDIRFGISIWNVGIVVREIDLTLNVGNIDSQLNLSLQGVNYSGALNNFLGNTVPTTLKNYETDINELLNIVVTDIIETYLSLNN